MPTAKEIVSNKPLAGVELKQIINNDIQRMLDKQPLLNGIAAFGRCSYEFVLKLHVDNPVYPTHEFSTRSKAPDETFPLANPSDKSIISGTEVKRGMDSPNRARIEEGLPIGVQFRGQDGHIQEREVEYDAAQLPPVETPAVTETDVSEKVAAEAGHPDLSLDLTEEEAINEMFKAPIAVDIAEDKAESEVGAHQAPRKLRARKLRRG